MSIRYLGPCVCPFVRCSVLFICHILGLCACPCVWQMFISVFLSMCLSVVQVHVCSSVCQMLGPMYLSMCLSDVWVNVTVHVSVRCLGQCVCLCVCQMFGFLCLSMHLSDVWACVSIHVSVRCSGPCACQVFGSMCPSGVRAHVSIHASVRCPTHVSVHVSGSVRWPLVAGSLRLWSLEAVGGTFPSLCLHHADAHGHRMTPGHWPLPQTDAGAAHPLLSKCVTRRRAERRRELACAVPCTVPGAAPPWWGPRRGAPQTEPRWVPAGPSRPAHVEEKPLR